MHERTACSEHPRRKREQRFGDCRPKDACTRLAGGGRNGARRANEPGFQPDDGQHRRDPRSRRRPRAKRPGARDRSTTRSRAPRWTRPRLPLTAAEKEVSAADSDLALAEATLKRYQQLYDKKSVSPQEFDEIKARNQSAEARRDMARAGQAQANAASRPGSHLARLYAHSCAVCRRGDGKKGRCRHVGLARHASLHH